VIIIIHGETSIKPSKSGITKEWPIVWINKLDIPQWFCYNQQSNQSVICISLKPSHRMPHTSTGIIFEIWQWPHCALCEASTHFFTFHEYVSWTIMPILCYYPILPDHSIQNLLVKLMEFIVLLVPYPWNIFRCSHNAKRYKKRKKYSIFYSMKNTWVVYSFGKDIQTLFWVQLQNTKYSQYYYYYLNNLRNFKRWKKKWWWWWWFYAH